MNADALTVRSCGVETGIGGKGPGRGYRAVAGSAGRRPQVWSPRLARLTLGLFGLDPWPAALDDARIPGTRYAASSL